MTSSIQFTALSGARDEGPFCYLLEIDDSKILLDCGGNGIIDGEMLHNLKRVANQIDVVLLSHSTLSHLGGYVYAYKHLGIKCATYSTLPVYNMGRISASDNCRANRKERGSDITQSDVDEAFDHITTLRYSQPTTLPGKCKEITVTSYAAGNSMGGSIWKIKKGTDEILYAVDYNHIRESHLEATSLLYRGQVVESMTKKTLLITDAHNVARVLPTQKARRDTFFNYIQSQTEAGGNVLIPVDCASRVLELIYLIERFMDSKTSQPQNSSNTAKNSINDIYLISRFGNKVMRFAQSMLEWVNESLANEFSKHRKNPFELKHIKIVNSLKELHKQLSKKYLVGNSLKPRGVVVLACGEDMCFSPSRDLFTKWADDESTLILLTQRGSKDSLARDLYDFWIGKASQIESQKLSDKKTNSTSSEQTMAIDSTVIPLGNIVNTDAEFDIRSYSKFELKGEELENWKEEQRRIKKTESAQLALLLEQEDEEEASENELLEAVESSQSNLLDDYTSRPTRFGSIGGDKKLDTIKENSALSKFLNGVIYDLYFEYPNPGDTTSSALGATNASYKHHSYPYVEKRKRTSDYGEVIDAEHFKKVLAVGSYLENSAGNNSSSNNTRSKSRNVNQIGSLPNAQNNDGKNDGYSNIENNDGFDDSSSDEESSLTPDNPGNNKLGDFNVSGKAYKYSKVSKKIHIRCTLTFIDFEGKADGRSMRNIVAQLEPRRIVVIGADSSSTDYFCQLCATNERMTNSIFAPSVGEVLNVSTRAKAYSVRLSDALLNAMKFTHPSFTRNSISMNTSRQNGISGGESMPKFDLFAKAASLTDYTTADPGRNSKFSRANDLSLARIRGVWKIYEDSNVPVLDLPNVEDLQLFNDIKYVGDLKLSILKDVLIANGINAVFKGDGVLTINDMITIEKADDGTAEITGNLSPEFFKVRSAIYSILASI